MPTPSTWTTPKPRGRSLLRAHPRLVVLTAAILVTTFAADLLLPRALPTWVPYLGAVLLGLASPGSRLGLVTAIASSLLVAAGALPVTQDVAVPDILGRIAALACIWTVAVLVTWTGRTRLAERTAARELRDVIWAVNQSAIVAMTDPRGAITFVNDKFCEISKYPRETLLGQDHRILNSSHHSKEYMRDLWRTIAQGRVWRGELRNRASDGTIYWVDTTIVPLLDERGMPARYVAIRYDITERKRAEEKLLENASLTRLGQMAAVVAHEVRNPLAGIAGALQVLRSRFECPERPVVDEMLARVGSLEAMVEDLLMFARPSAPRQDAIDLSATCMAVIDILAGDATCREVRLRLEGGTGIVVRGDAQQLRAVLTNLVLNAAQAGNGRGDIDLIVSNQGDWARIDVVDRGPGIPPGSHEKIFEPFFTTRHRGTGLGLAIARRLVEMHGGSLLASTTPGGGATLTLRLPAASAVPPAGADA